MRDVGIRCRSLASAQSAWLEAMKLFRLHRVRKFGDAARSEQRSRQLEKLFSK
jgi:hypothetical protein